MNAHFGIAFWNTGLAPPRKSNGSVERSVHAAAAIIAEVAEQGINLFALCEVDEDIVLLIRTLVPRFAGYEYALFDETTDSKSWNLGFFYDPSVLHIERSKKIEAQLGNLTARAALHLNVTFVGDGHSIDIYLVHWPSHISGNNLRSECARELNRHVHEIGIHARGVIMFGDFNDDPFSDSMSTLLRSTRDPGCAWDRQILFNASWSFLSGDFLDRTNAFGTAFYANGTYSRWNTFDQLVVSPNLLGTEQGLSLARVMRFDAAYRTHNPKHQARRASFDHLPIAAWFDRSEKQ